jgi:PhnB protein
MTITAHIVVRDAHRAASFYREAFGAEELGRIPVPDGRLMSLQLRIGESVLHVADEFPDVGVVGPESLGGSPVVLSVDVADADAAFERALHAGATPRQPVSEAFWGDRHGLLEDPFGHRWSVTQHVRDVSHDELVAGAAKLFG